MNLFKIKNELRHNSDKDKANIMQSFFKTGKGEYGEGDIFLGLTVPLQRKIAKKYFNDIELKEIKELIYSKYHEFRLTGFLILLFKYEKALTRKEKTKYYEFALKNIFQFNNWDLVDVIVPKLIGDYIYNYDKVEGKKLLLQFSKSSNLWVKRVSILATFYYIRQNSLNLTLQLSKNLLNDKHDLIHKAVGWMLREVGKVNLEVEEKFLQEKGRYKKIPRTMLRYAIEKFEEKKRKKYLKGLI